MVARHGTPLPDGSVLAASLDFERENSNKAAWTSTRSSPRTSAERRGELGERQSIPTAQQRLRPATNGLEEPLRPVIDSQDEESCRGTKHDSELNQLWLGLSAAQKSVPCSFLYDQRGSQLYDEITAVSIQPQQ
jgi:Histidine-specific methyltransferase, SAM-dependent